MSIALQARHVVHRFGAAPVLEDVSLDVPESSLVAIVGESGSGKTTLLRLFNRLADPLAGEVLVGGDEVRTLDPIALRRRIGYVPQHGGLLPHWTVAANVALVPRLAGLRDAEAAANDALALVGLPAATFGARLPRQLSGGQRQRAALARALAARQQAVLLDEPFGALDAIARAEMHETFDRVRRQSAFTALLVTHDLAEAARLADAIAVMRQGRIEQFGTVDDLRRRPASAYVETLFRRAAASAGVLGAS